MSITDPQDIPTPPINAQGVWPPAPVGQPVQTSTPPIPQFPRFNALLLFLLHYCTLSIYSIYWINRTITIANTRTSRTAIPRFSVWLIIILLAAFFGVGITEGLTGKHYDDTLLRLLFGVVWLSVSFMLRGAVNEALPVLPGDLAYIDKFGTFFLSIFYIQHKINVFIKHNPSA